jgi:hypothetical protein
MMMATTVMEEMVLLEEQTSVEYEETADAKD